MPTATRSATARAEPDAGAFITGLLRDTSLPVQDLLERMDESGFTPADHAAAVLDGFIARHGGDKPVRHRADPTRDATGMRRWADGLSRAEPARFDACVTAALRGHSPGETKAILGHLEGRDRLGPKEDAVGWPVERHMAAVVSVVDPVLPRMDDGDRAQALRIIRRIADRDPIGTADALTPILDRLGRAKSEMWGDHLIGLATPAWVDAHPDIWHERCGRITACGWGDPHAQPMPRGYRGRLCLLIDAAARGLPVDRAREAVRHDAGDQFAWRTARWMRRTSEPVVREWDQIQAIIDGCREATAFRAVSGRQAALAFAVRRELAVMAPADLTAIGCSWHPSHMPGKIAQLDAAIAMAFTGDDAAMATTQAAQEIERAVHAADGLHAPPSMSRPAPTTLAMLNEATALPPDAAVGIAGAIAMIGSHP